MRGWCDEPSGGGATLVGAHDLRGCISQGEPNLYGLTNGGYKAKVDERPAISARLPHDVGLFQIPVHVPRTVQVTQPLSDVMQHLHTHPSWLGNNNDCCAL